MPTAPRLLVPVAVPSRFDHFTVIRSWILENSPSLMPLDLLDVFDRLERPSLDDGLGFHGADARQGVELFLGGGVDIDLLAGASLGHGLGRERSTWRRRSRVAAVLAAAGAGSSPIVTRSRSASIRVLPRPLILSRSSTDFQGRPAMIAFAVAGPMPGRASSAASVGRIEIHLAGRGFLGVIGSWLRLSTWRSWTWQPSRRPR